MDWAPHDATTWRERYANWVQDTDWDAALWCLFPYIMAAVMFGSATIAVGIYCGVASLIGSGCR